MHTKITMNNEVHRQEVCPQTISLWSHGIKMRHTWYPHETSNNHEETIYSLYSNKSRPDASNLSFMSQNYCMYFQIPKTKKNKVLRVRWQQRCAHLVYIHLPICFALCAHLYMHACVCVFKVCTSSNKLLTKLGEFKFKV